MKRSRYLDSTLKSLNALVVASGLCGVSVSTAPHALAAPQSTRPPTASATRALEFKPEKVKVFLAPPSAWPGQTMLKTAELSPSIPTLRARIEASLKRPEFAEPVVLRLTTHSALPILKQLGNETILKRLSDTTLAPRLIEEFKRRVLSRAEDMRLAIRPSDLGWLDLDKLARTLEMATVVPSFPVADWQRVMQADTPESAAAQDHFGQQFERISKAARAHLEHHPEASQLPMHEILPDHMKKLMGRFSPLRGRNCFATALSFLDANVVGMKNINMVREEGHHSAMINNDEFAHALWLGYYELDAQEILAGLRYGDIVAFIDAHEGNSYVAYKHAAVHVAGQVYLHKQSKSASTPIEFTQWRDLVLTWGALAKSLDYKVYRKLPQSSLRSQDSKIAIEKIFWTQ